MRRFVHTHSLGNLIRARPASAVSLSTIQASYSPGLGRLNRHFPRILYQSQILQSVNGTKSWQDVRSLITVTQRDISTKCSAVYAVYRRCLYVRKTPEAMKPSPHIFSVLLAQEPRELRRISSYVYRTRKGFRDASLLEMFLDFKLSISRPGSSPIILLSSGV